MRMLSGQRLLDDVPSGHERAVGKPHWTADSPEVSWIGILARTQVEAQVVKLAMSKGREAVATYLDVPCAYLICVCLRAGKAYRLVVEISSYGLKPGFISLNRSKNANMSENSRDITNPYESV